MECREISPSEPWRQGDVISFNPAGIAYFGCPLGLVISADCDIANKKLDGFFSFLPVFSLKAYLEKFWLHRFFERRSRELCGKIYQADISEDDIESTIDWMTDESVGGVVENLLKGESPAKIEKMIREFKEIVSFRNRPQGGFDVFERFCSAQQNPEKYARSQILDAVKSLGDGAFLINEIPTLDEYGFVIQLRRVHSIQEDCCVPSPPKPDSFTSNSDAFQAYRVARLNNNFKYRVSQIFSAQFSRIGLPEDFYELNSLSIDFLVHETMKGDNL